MEFFLCWTKNVCCQKVQKQGSFLTKEKEDNSWHQSWNYNHAAVLKCDIFKPYIIYWNSNWNNFILCVFWFFSSLLQKLNGNHTSSQVFMSPSNIKKRSEYFVVKHFPGPVTYNITGFIAGNKDVIHFHLQELLQNSMDPFIRGLFSQSENASKISITTQLRQQINELWNEISSTECHYIRCISPNKKK